MLKRLLKSKKGSSVVVLVCLIPTIILLVFGVAYKNMVVSVGEKKIVTYINNALYYGSKTYGSVRNDNEKGNFCVFIPQEIFGNGFNEDSVINQNNEDLNEESFAYELVNVIRKIDGYNELWEYEICLDKNTDGQYDVSKNHNNMYIRIKMKIVLPRVLNVTNFGVSNAKEGIITGWYQKNQSVWEEYKRLYLQDPHKNKDQFIIIDNFISTGSCV